MRLTFVLDMPKAVVTGASASRGGRRFAPLICALEALTTINQWQLRRRTDIPPLYQSGVFYRPEDYPREEWLDAPTAYQRGYADCEDLGCWRAAELRNQHRDDGFASPVIKSREISLGGSAGFITVIHVMVRYRNGQLEDPSKILGMQGEYQ